MRYYFHFRTKNGTCLPSGIEKYHEANNFESALKLASQINASHSDVFIFHIEEVDTGRIIEL